MDVTESTLDVELCEETEGEVSSTCNDNVRLDGNSVNSDIISSDSQSFVMMSNDSSENTAVLQEETSHSLSPDTSGVVLRYVSEGDGVVCMPFEAQGDMNSVEIQEDLVEEEEVSLTSDLETVPEVSIPAATNDERETISLEENVLISTTMDEGEYAVLNWEGEEIVEMSSADNLDLQEQMEQSVDVSSATQDTSSLDAEGGAQLAAQSLPFASNPDSTTIETPEANNNIVIYENEVSTTGDELCMVSTSLVIPVSTTTAVASNESLSVPGSSTSVTAVHSSGNIPICMPRQRREESQLSSEISPQNSGISTTSLKDESAHKRRWDQVPVSDSCNLSSITERLLTSQSSSQREGMSVSFERVNPTCSGKNRSEKVPKLDPVSSSKDSNLHSHTLARPSVSYHQESNIDTTSQAQFRSISHPSQKVGRDLGSTSDSTTTDAGISKVKDSSVVASSDMASFKEDYGNGATSSTSNDDSLEHRVPSVNDRNNQVSKTSEAVALEQNTCEISDTNNGLKSPHPSGSQDPGELPEATHSGLQDNSEMSPSSPLNDRGKDVVSHTEEDDRAKHTEASSGLLGTVPAEPCPRIDDRMLTSSGDPPTSSGGEKLSNRTVKHPERKSTDHGNEKSRFSILSGCRKPLVGSSVSSETLKSSRLGAGKGSPEESLKESKILEDVAESLPVEDAAATSDPSSSGLHKAGGSTETKNISSSPSQENKTSDSRMASRNVVCASVSMTSSSPEERNCSKGAGNLAALKVSVKVSDSSLLKTQEYSKTTVELRQPVPKAEGISATCCEDRQQDVPGLCDKSEIGHSESEIKSSVIVKASDETTSSSTGDNMKSPKEDCSLSKESEKIFSDSNEGGSVAKPGEPASLSPREDPTKFDNQTTKMKSPNQLEEVVSIGTKTSLKSENDSEKMKFDHSQTQKHENIKTYSRFTSVGGKSAIRSKGPHIISSQAIKLERPETVKTSRWDVATFAPKTKHDALHRDIAKISDKEKMPSHSGDGNLKLRRDDELTSVKGTSKTSVSCTESTPKIGIVSSYCKGRDKPSGKEAVTPVSKGDMIGRDPIVTAPCSSSKSEDSKSNVLKSVGVESKLTLNIKSDSSQTTKVDSISSSTAPIKTRVKLVRPPLSSVRESSSVTSSKLTIHDSCKEKFSEKKPEVAVAAKTTSKGDVISTTEETDKEKEMEDLKEKEMEDLKEKEMEDLDSELHSFPKEMRTYSRLDVMQSKGSHSKKMSLNTKELLLKRDVEKKEESQHRSIISVPKQATARPSIHKSYMQDCTFLPSKEYPSPIKFESKASKMEKDDIKGDDNALCTETIKTTDTSEETTSIQPLTLKPVVELNIDIKTAGKGHLQEEIKSTTDNLEKSLCDKTEVVTGKVYSTPSNLNSKEQHTREDQPFLLETQQDRKTSAEDPSSVLKSEVNHDVDMTSTDRCQSVGKIIKTVELQSTSKAVTSDEKICTVISSKSTVGQEIISLSTPGEKTTERTVETKETNRTKGRYGLPIKENRSLALGMDPGEGLEILQKSEPTNPSGVDIFGCNLTKERGEQNVMDIISEERLDKPEQLSEDRPDITEVKQSSELLDESSEEGVIHGHIKTDSREIVKETTGHTEEIKDIAFVENSDDEKKSEKSTQKSQPRQKYEEHEVLQMLTEEKLEESVKEPSHTENLESFKSTEEEGIMVYAMEEDNVSLGVCSGVEDSTILRQPEKEEVSEIKNTAGGHYSVESVESVGSEERRSQSTAEASSSADKDQKDLTKLLKKSDSSEQELKKTALNKNLDLELRPEVLEDSSQSEKQNTGGETSQPRAENNTDVKASAVEGNVSQSSDFDQTSEENIIQTPSASVESLGIVQKKDDESIVSQSFDSQSDTTEVSKTSEEDKKEDITSNIVKPVEEEPEVMVSVPSEEVSAIIKPDSTVELKISTCAEKTDEWEIFEGSDTEKSQKEDTDGVSSGSGDELEEIAAFLRQSEEESRIGSSHEGKELGEAVSIITTSSRDNREGSTVKESTVTEGKREETEITIATEHGLKQESKDSSVTDSSEQNTTASSSQEDKDVVTDGPILSEKCSKEVNQEDMISESGSFSAEKVVSVTIQDILEGKPNDSVTEIDKNASEDQSQSGENGISSSNVEEAEPAVGKTEKIILKITKDKKSPQEFSVQEIEDGRKTESDNSGGAATVQNFELASSSDPASLKVTVKASEQSAESDRKTPITLKLVKDASSEGKPSGPEYVSVPSALQEGNVKKTEYGEQASSENTKGDKFMSKKEARKLETSVSSSTSAVMASSDCASQPSQVSSSGMSDESEVGKLTLKLKLSSPNETGSVAVVPKASIGVKPGSSKQLESSSVHEEEQPKVEKLTLKLKKDGNCENVTYTKSEIKAEVSPKVEKLTIKTKMDGSSECIVAEPIYEKALDASQNMDNISLEQSPKVEKLTLRLRKDSVGSDSSKSHAESSETKHSGAEDSPKREKITLRIRTDSGSSEISNASKRSRKDSCSSEVCESVKRPRRDSSNSEFSVVYEKTTSGSPKVTDTRTEECTSSEKITLTLRKVPSNSELLSTQEEAAASGDNLGISEDDQLSSSVSREENKVAKLTLKLKPDPSKVDKKDGKEASLLEDAITSTSNVDKSEETPRVEKLTLKLKKDQVSSAKDVDTTDSSASSDVSKFEKDHQEEQKVEKLTLKLKKDQVSSAKDVDITDSSSSSDVSKFEKDHKEEQKVEKLTLKLKKDQVSSAKDVDITDSSASSDVSNLEKDHQEEQKVEKLTLKLKKDQVSSAKDVDTTDSSASSDVSKFEKDHQEEQKVEKLTLKLKKDQVSSAKDVDTTDSSASSDVSKFEKDHKEEQKVEKLTLKLKKDQVSSAKDVDITDSSASSDVSKFEKDQEEQKVEKLTLKLKKDQVSSAKDVDITDSSASLDVSNLEKDHQEEQQVEKLTLKLKKDQVSSAKVVDITDSSSSSDVSKFEEEQKVEKLTLKVKKDQVSSVKDVDIMESSSLSDVSQFEEEQKVEKLTLKLRKDSVSGSDDSSEGAKSKLESTFKEEQKVEKLTLKLKKDAVRCDSPSDNKSAGKDEKKEEKLTLKLMKDMSKSDISDKEENKVERITIKRRKESAHDAETKQPLQEYTISPTEKKKPITVGTGKEEVKLDKVTLKIKKDGSKSEITTPFLSDVKPHSEIKAKKSTSKAETPALCTTTYDKTNTNVETEKSASESEMMSPSMTDDKTHCEIKAKKITSKSETVLPPSGIGSKTETTPLSTSTSDKSSINVESKKSGSKSEAVLSSSSINEEKLSKDTTNKNSSKVAPSSNTSEEIRTGLEAVLSPSGSGEGMLSEVEINVEAKKNTSKFEAVLSFSGAGEGMLSEVEIDKNISKSASSSKTSEEIHTDVEAEKRASKSEAVLSSSGAGEGMLSEVEINVEAKKNTSKSEAVLSSSGVGEGMPCEVEIKKNSAEAAPSSKTSDKTHTDVETKKNTSEVEEVPQLLTVRDETLSKVLVAEENTKIETVSPSSSTTDKTHTDVKTNKEAPLFKTPLSASLEDEKYTDNNDSKIDGLPALSSDKTGESHTDKEIKEGDPKSEKVPTPPALDADNKHTDSKIEQDDLKDDTVSPSFLSDKSHTDVNIKRADSKVEVILSPTSSISDETLTNPDIPGTVSPSSSSTKEKVHFDESIDVVVSPSEVRIKETEMRDNLKLSSEVISSERTDSTTEGEKPSPTSLKNVQDLAVGKGEVDKDKPVSKEESKHDGGNDRNSIVEKSPSEQYELSGTEESMTELKTEKGKSSNAVRQLDDKEEGMRRLETKGEKQSKLKTKADAKKEITATLQAKVDKRLCSEARLDEKEEGKAKLGTGGEKILRLETKVDGKEEKLATLKTKEEKLPVTGTRLDDKEESKAKLETKGEEQSKLYIKVDVKEEKIGMLKTKEKKLMNVKLDDKGKVMKKLATKGEELEEKVDTREKIKATVKAKEGKHPNTGAKLDDKEERMEKGEKQSKLEPKVDAKEKIPATVKSKEEKLLNTGVKLDDKEGMEKGEKQSKLEPKVDAKEKIPATVKSKEEKLLNTGVKLDDDKERREKGEKQSKLEPKVDAKEKIPATVKSKEEILLNTGAKLDDKEGMEKGEKQSKLEPKVDAKEKIPATVKSKEEKLLNTGAKLDDKEGMEKGEKQSKLEPKVDAKEKIPAMVKSKEEILLNTGAKLDDDKERREKGEKQSKLEPKVDAKEKIPATVKSKEEILLNTGVKLGDKEARMEKGEKQSKLEPKVDAEEEGKETLKIQEGKISNTGAKSDVKEEKTTKLDIKTEKSSKLEAKLEKPSLKRKIDSKTCDASADVNGENKMTSKPSRSAPLQGIINVDSVSEKLISEDSAIEKISTAPVETTFEEKQLPKTKMKLTAKEDEEPKCKRLKVEDKVLELPIVPPPVDEVSQDVEVIYSAVGHSGKQERIQPSPPRVEGKLREILSKMGGQASKLLDSDLTISISQPEATPPPVSQDPPGYMKITLVPDDKEVINLDSDSDTVGSTAAVPTVSPSPEQFEPLGPTRGLSTDTGEPAKKKGRGRPRKSTLPAKPIPPRPVESRPKRTCRGREGPIVELKKPRGGGRGRGRGRAAGLKRKADEDTTERKPGDGAFSEVSPTITASSPKIPRMSSPVDSTLSTSPPSSPPPRTSLSSISVFGIPTPKCDNSLPSTTDSIITTTTTVTSPTAGVKPSSTFSSILATAESTSAEAAGVTTAVTTSSPSAFFSLPTSISATSLSAKNAVPASSTSSIPQATTVTTQAVMSTDTAPASTSKPAMSFLTSSPESSGLSSFLSAPSRNEPELPTSGLPVSTVQVFEEETRMSADCGSRSQTPARTLPSAGGGDGAGEESQGSAISTATTESVKKKTSGRMEVGDGEMKEFTVDQIAEYQWPPDKNGEHLMVQEQISEYLGVKSFKRKYPDLRRRFIDSEERTYLREKGLVSEGMCDMGLTAIYTSEVLDVMFNDFQEKYEEYRRYQRDRQAKELTSKQKGIAAAASADKSKQDYKEKAISSAASWNAKFNRARKDGRRACFDLQSFTIHYPRTRTEKMAAKDLAKIGQYPIALIPGQFTDFYKSYTPTELRYFPLNTVLYGPMKPNERQEATGSDGSQSDSDESSSSDDSSSSSSSDGTQDTEETASTNGDGDQDVGPENGPAEKEGPEKAKDKGGVKERDGAVCKVCSGDKGKNKEGRPEVLIHCATCTSSGHVSCFDLTLDMVPHIRRYDWQCTDCKTCIQCKDPADEDKMLFCDMCDRGYHIYCVGLRRVPNGRWHCKECAVCGSCGAQEPCGNADPSSTPNAQWQHEYKKGEKGTRVYAQTLCVPCSKLWRKGRYCQLCWRCYGNKPEEEVGLINCTVCDKWMHADCCNTVGGIEVSRSNYLCEICQEKGQARSPAVKLAMRPAVKV